MCLAASERTILVDFRFILVDLEIQVVKKIRGQNNRYKPRIPARTLNCTAPNKSMRKSKGKHAMFSILVLLVITTASSFVHAGGESESNMNCPVVPTVEDFDIEEYASKPWYVQAQLPNRYQPIENLFCVRAVYTITSPTTLDVFNFARKGSVEGEPSNEGMVLNAFIPNVAIKSKLKVGPKFVPRVLYGDYWIVAREEDWAIISGGQPTIEVSDGLCTTESADNVRNQGGLWLFTREKEVSDELVETMKKKAKELGIDTSMLKKVEQKGCEYP